MVKTWPIPGTPCDMVCPDCRAPIPRFTTFHQCAGSPRVTTAWDESPTVTAARLS